MSVATRQTVARAELFRALAACLAPPGVGLVGVVDALGLPDVPSVADHTDLFLFQLHPFASVHLDPDGQLGGVSRDRVAGFLRALEVTPPPEPDHLVVLVEAYASLIDLDGGVGTRARLARTVLLHEHLWTWAPRFLARVGELGGPFHREVAGLLSRALVDEVAELGTPPGLPAPLLDVAPMTDPRDGEAASFLTDLLAPVRSGLVLARADLARAARALGLGLRIGERAYLLRALLAQDAVATLRFLAEEARRQRDLVPDVDPVTGYWRDRADATASLLDELVADGASTPVAG